jgi:TolB protein
LSSNLEGLPPYRVGGFWEDAQPDWSPGEYRLVFASQREVDRRWRLYTSWGDGTNEINLRREGKSPTFAPDGYRFAFEGCDDTGNRCGLWLADLDNSEYGAYPILEDPLARSPDWSPAGEQIAYMANPDGNWDLYLINSDGNNVRRLTTERAVDGLPVWSPDGQWLAFLSNRDGTWGIWLLHVESDRTQQVISLAGATFIPPERSPYGQRNWWDEQLSWSW